MICWGCFLLIKNPCKSEIRIEEGRIRSHVDEMVCSTVEERLDAMLSAEADALCGAQRYERSADRVDTRAALCANTSASCSRRRAK